MFSIILETIIRISWHSWIYGSTIFSSTKEVSLIKDSQYLVSLVSLRTMAYLAIKSFFVRVHSLWQRICHAEFISASEQWDSETSSEWHDIVCS